MQKFGNKFILNNGIFITADRHVNWYNKLGKQFDIIFKVKYEHVLYPRNSSL